MSAASETLPYRIVLGCAATAGSPNKRRAMVAVLASVPLRRPAVRSLGHVEAPTAGRDHTKHYSRPGRAWFHANRGSHRQDGRAMFSQMRATCVAAASCEMS
eukprot:3540017-Pleurochrysis_carterae.AAC.3